MKSKLDMVRFAALVERYATPLLEDSVNNEEGGYEMDVKHTPGPWRACGSFIGTDETDSQTIAYLSNHRNRKPRLTVEQAANGALIAAAPRIKTALEGLLVAVNDSLVKAEPKVIVAMREAYAAIEEATK